MTVILQGRRARLATVPFLFRASECLDESGLFALSYGRRIASVFSRTLRAAVVDADGRETIAPPGFPRLVADPTPVLRLEPFRTNGCPRSREFDTWSSVGSVTVTPNERRGPDGSFVVDRITATAAGPASAAVRRTLTLSGDGTKAFSVRLAVGNGVNATVMIYDATALVTRAQFTVAFNGANQPAITLTSGSGSMLGSARSPDGLWRALLTADNVVAANTNELRIYVNNVGQAVAGDYIFAVDAQVEDGTEPTSVIRTGAGTESRTLDSLAFVVPGLDPVRAFSVLARTVNRGAYLGTGGSVKRVLSIGSANTGLDPRLSLYGNNFGNAPLLYDDGVSGPIFSTATLTPPAWGALIEHRGVLRSDGSIVAGCRVNGGNESVGAASAASSTGMPWAAAQVWFTGGLIAAVDFTHAVVAEGERSMDQLLELAGV